MNLKIVTLNLRHNEDRWEERLPLVIDALHQEQADIIALQEVYFPIQQADVIADALNARTPNAPYNVYGEPKWGDNQDEGVALLTRALVLEQERLELPEGERVAQRIAAQIDGRTFHVANTHLHHRPMEDESIRLPQMQALLAWMDDRAPGGWLLMGDLNALPGSSTIAAAETKLRSAYFAVHQAHPITFPSPLSRHYVTGVQITLDYVFFDPAVFEAVEARVIADRPHPDDATLYPSDHFGLAAVFRLR